MEQDKMRDEALAKIAEKWRDAAALGCVDALECALREAWQASREAVVVELPPSEFFDDGENEYGYKVSVEAYRADAALAAIHAAGIRTR